jgi:hypothetical protein
MAPHPLREASTGAAHIDIIARREGESPQLPNSDGSLPFVSNDESIGPFFHTKDFTFFALFDRSAPGGSRLCRAQLRVHSNISYSSKKALLCGSRFYLMPPKLWAFATALNKGSAKFEKCGSRFYLVPPKLWAFAAALNKGSAKFEKCGRLTP